jgi:hypothetical protein
MRTFWIAAIKNGKEWEWKRMERMGSNGKNERMEEWGQGRVALI